MSDPYTMEILPPDELIDKLSAWRDRARRHARWDEATWYTKLIEAIEIDQAELDQIHHHVDGGASSA